ncbi:MAG: hypothetical protein H5T65_04960 [Chloroflexi bacterium]|nr:hypothetical protein [Chloroflexota bacterium]
MAPWVTRARVAEVRVLDPDLLWLRLRAPDVAASLRPGQFIAVVDRQRLEPYLPTPLFPTHLSAEDLGCLLQMDDRDRWLATLWPERPIQVTGPLGNGFALNAAARNLLVVSEGMEGLPLLTLVQEAAARRLEVSFLVWSPFSRAELLPPGLLPSSAEYRSAVGTEALTAALSETLRWADAAYAAGSPALHLALAEAIQQVRLRYARGFCQVLVRGRMLCALGVCGVCRIRLRRGSARVCADGPVFDLRDLV